VRHLYCRIIKFVLPNLITALLVYYFVQVEPSSENKKVALRSLKYSDLREEMAFNALPYDELQRRGKAGDYMYHKQNSSAPYSGLASRFHDNGQVETLLSLKEGKIISAKGWNELGQTTSTHVENGTGFIMELKDIMTGFIYDKGQLIAYRGRNQSGKLFRQSLTDGAHHIYDPNGQIRENGNYHKGHKDGVWKYWNHDGVLVREINYDQGLLNGVCREWHDNGKIKKHFTVKSGEPHGMWAEYNDKGRLIEVKKYSYGAAEGTWKSFHDDGSIRFEGMFKGDERYGTHRWWKRNGELEKSFFYTRGIRAI
jgi:antitoxin component YwqK of YwqJK toxin-antitoxin module